VIVTEKEVEVVYRALIVALSQNLSEKFRVTPSKNNFF
jgi:hypothetical protein